MNEAKASYADLKSHIGILQKWINDRDELIEQLRQEIDRLESALDDVRFQED